MGRVAFQVLSEGRVSLTLPLESNTGRASGEIVRHTFVTGSATSGRNSLDESGRWLAYPKSFKNESQIWVKDLMTGEDRHLVTTPSISIPIISLDGSKVAYSVSAATRPAGYVIPAAGGSARQVCDECSLYGWFSDGRRILATNPAGTCARSTWLMVRQWTCWSIQPVPLGGPKYRATAVGSASTLTVKSGSRRCGPTTLLHKANGYRCTPVQRTPPNAPAAGRRIRDCCIYCSNATVFGICTRSASTLRTARLSVNPSSSNTCTIRGGDGDRRPMARPSFGTHSFSVRSR